MNRQDIRVDSPTEKGRGFMPGVSVNPGRLLFTAGMTGRNPDGSIVPGGMGQQTQRTFERLHAIVEHAGGRVQQAIKQMLYVTDLAAYYDAGRAARAPFFADARPASTGLIVRRLADLSMLIEVELVVDLAGPAQGAFRIEKFDVEQHGLDFNQGVIVNGGRLIYLAGQVANHPDGTVAGHNDLAQQATKVYENIGHVLQAAGATPANAVKETTWVLDLEAWRQHGPPVRRAFYKGDFPASTLVEIPGLARPEFLVEVEVIAAVA